MNNNIATPKKEKNPYTSDRSKTMVIFSQSLAGYLMFQGFVLIAMKPNYTDETKNVFYFNNSKALRDEIRLYVQMYTTGSNKAMYD